MVRRPASDLSPRGLPCTIGGASGRLRPRLGALLLAGVFVLLAAACYNSTTGDTEILGIAKFKLPVLPKTGAHKVEVFTEMHYQPSFRVQEGPRLLPAPDSALGAPGLVTRPGTIRVEPEFATIDEYRSVAMPQDIVQAYDEAGAAELYRVNCAVCHGAAKRGDVRFAVVMKERGASGPRPADLTSDQTQDLADGELFAFISEGGRQGFALISLGLESRSPMPPFKRLLSQEDRWALVRFLRPR